MNEKKTMTPRTIFKAQSIAEHESGKSLPPLHSGLLNR
jgi:hypothetical protein